MLTATAKKNVRPLLLPRTYFCLVALCVVGLLCALPQTGWIARRQLTGRGSTPNGQNIEVESNVDTFWIQQQKPQAAVEKQRDHLDVQLAWDVERQKWEARLASLELDEKNLPDGVRVAALEQERSASKSRLLTRIWELRTVFPGSPALYASYLRYACVDNTSIGRNLERELVFCKTVSEAQERLRKRRALSGTPQKLSLWEADPVFVQKVLEAARQGEQCDPANSFFPMMQAAALFAQKRDECALQCLERAASCPDWDDYLRWDATGKIKLSEAVNGPMSAGERELHALSFNAPHLATLRATGTFAVTLAALRERRQNFAGGLRIRKAVARLGMRLRVAAPYYAANIRGFDFICFAAWRPGGVARRNATASANAAGLRSVGEAPYEDFSYPTGSEEQEGFSRSRTSQEPGRRYVAYLRQRGEAEEARWYAQESATANRTHDFTDKSRYGAVFAQLLQLDVLWLTGSALIAQLFSVLLLGGIGAWLTRSTRGRTGAPLGREGRWAFAVIPIALLVGVCGCALADYLDSSLADLAYRLFDKCDFLPYIRLNWGGAGNNICGALSVLLTIALPLLALRKPPRGEDWMQGERKTRFRTAIWRYTQTLGLTVTFVAVLLLLNAFYLQGSVMSSFFAALFSGWVQGTPPFPLDPVAGTVCASVGAVIPLCVVSALIISLVRRVPVSVGLSCAAYRTALPLAMGLLIVWGGTVLLTVFQEAKICRALAIAAQHEGRYQAASVGATWPGVTPEVETAPVVGKGERL